MYTTSHPADINDMAAMVWDARRFMKQALDAMSRMDAAGRTYEDTERGMAAIRRMIGRIESVERRARLCSRFGWQDEVNRQCGVAHALLHKLWDACIQLQRDVDRHLS